jgi:hypothetical protein
MTSRAFDLALFVGTPVNVNDASVVAGTGPPFVTTFKAVALSSPPGVVVHANVPAASAQNQIMISGPGPTYAWALGTNPAASAAVPPPDAVGQVLIADGAPTWTTTTADALVQYGGACMLASGGVFSVAAKLTFMTTASLSVCVDGGDSSLSALDNFAIDAGTF